MGVRVAIDVESNNKLLFSVKDLGYVDENRMSNSACQIRSMDFVCEMIDMRWTSSARGEGFMFTCGLMGR